MELTSGEGTQYISGRFVQYGFSKVGFFGTDFVWNRKQGPLFVRGLKLTSQNQGELSLHGSGLYICCEIYMKSVDIQQYM